MTGIQFEARTYRKKRITITWEREQSAGDLQVDQQFAEPISIAKKRQSRAYPRWSNPCPLE